MSFPASRYWVICTVFLLVLIPLAAAETIEIGITNNVPVYEPQEPLNGTVHETNGPSIGR